MELEQGLEQWENLVMINLELSFKVNKDQLLENQKKFENDLDKTIRKWCSFWKKDWGSQSDKTIDQEID